MTNTDQSLAPKDQPDDLVDDFLAHYGVKGMRWGQRTSRVSAGTSKSRKSFGNGDGRLSKTEAKTVALASAKVALKYGAPSAAVAVGAAVGFPAIAALGISARVLQDPAVQEAVAVGARFTKSAMPDIGSMPMPKVPSVSMPKIDIPEIKLPKDVFQTKRTTRTLTVENDPNKLVRISVNGDTVKVPLSQVDKFLPQADSLDAIADK